MPQSIKKANRKCQFQHPLLLPLYITNVRNPQQKASQLCNAGICYLWYYNSERHVMNSLKVRNIMLQLWYFFATTSATIGSNNI